MIHIKTFKLGRGARLLIKHCQGKHRRYIRKLAFRPHVQQIVWLRSIRLIT